MGDPFSHRQLAERYERGEEVPQDFEKALFQRAIETRLFEKLGDEQDAVIARARRGADARAIAPEAAVWRARLPCGRGRRRDDRELGLWCRNCPAAGAGMADQRHDFPVKPVDSLRSQIPIRLNWWRLAKRLR